MDLRMRIVEKKSDTRVLEDIVDTESDIRYLTAARRP